MKSYFVFFILICFFQSLSFSRDISPLPQIVNTPHEINDNEMAKRLKEWNRVLVDDLAKRNWKRKNTYIDSLRAGLAAYNDPIQRAVYNMMLVKWIPYGSSSGLKEEGDFNRMPIEQWSQKQMRDAIDFYLREALSDKILLQQNDGSAYRELLDINALNDCKTLYQLLLVDAVNYATDEELKHHLIEELYHAGKDNYSLYVSAFLAQRKERGGQAGYLQEQNQLIREHADDPVTIKLIENRLIHLYREATPDDRKNEAYYQQIYKEGNEALTNFDKSKYRDVIDQIVKQLTSQTVDINLSKQVYPNKEFKVEIKQNNNKKLYLDIYKSTNDSLSHAWSNSLGISLILRNAVEKELITENNKLSRNEIKFDNKFYIEQKKNVELKIRDIGYYFLVCRDENEKLLSLAMIHVSRLAPICLRTNGYGAIYVVNYESGKPYKKVDIDYYTPFVKKEQSIQTQEIDRQRGSTNIEVPNKGIERGISFLTRVGKDRYAPISVAYQHHMPRLKGPKVRIYPDRSRYELGDTIHYRGYCYYPEKEMIAGKEIECYLKGGNNKKINGQSHKTITDEWGGFSGYFVTSEEGLSGIYFLSTIYGSTPVSVGKFKYPTVNVEMKTDRENYILGDQVKVKGTVEAYAGFPVENATVECIVEMRPNYRFRNTAKSKLSPILLTSTSNERGEFAFNFSLPKDDSLDGLNLIIPIHIQVTTPSGETKRVEKYVSLGKKRYKFGLNAPKLINNERGADLIVHAKDANWKNIPDLDVNYRVLKDNQEIDSGKFQSSTPFQLDWSTLDCGKYQIEINSEEADTLVHNFMLYSPKKKNSFIDTTFIFTAINTDVSENEPIRFVLGTNQKKVYPLVELYSESGREYYDLIQLKEGIREYTIPYDKDYPENMSMVITMFYNGKLYKANCLIKNTSTESELDVSIHTLRKISSPGAKEEVELSVVDKKSGKGIVADVVLTIYDIAQDPNVPRIYRPLNKKWLLLPSSLFVNSSSEVMNRMWSGSRNSHILRSSEKAYNLSLNDVFTCLEPSGGDNCEVHFDKEGVIVGGKGDEVRKQFGPTALFATNVRTDSTGKIKLTYQLPDAVTTYRIEAFVTNKQAVSAVNKSEIIASKELMVIPNLPQFFREGDKMKLRTNCVNTTNVAIEANARIELYDIISNEILFQKEQNVSLDANSTEVVIWTLPTINYKQNKIGVRSSLISSQHSDSEQQEVVIIPAVESMTTSKSYFMDAGKQHKYIDLKKFLQKRVENEQINVIIGSPLEQMLRTLSNYEIDLKQRSVIDLINQWCMLDMGSRMVSQYKPMIDQWKNEQLHHRNQNEMIDTILGVTPLSTPWDAYFQQLNIEKLEQLLDREFVQSAQEELWKKISTYENKDGGIGWYKGMPSSFFMTAYLLERYAMACELEQQERALDNPLIKTMVDYIDLQMLEANEKGDVASHDVNLNSYYYYLRTSLKEMEMSDEVKTFLNRIEQDANRKNLSLPCMMYFAFGLENQGKSNADLLKKISRYAVKNSTLGYYFPNAIMPLRGMIYEEVSIHTDLLRLFDRNGNYPELAKGIAQWLMLQRKNQSWSNNVATVNATQVLWDYYRRHFPATQTASNGVNISGINHTSIPMGYHFNVKDIRSGRSTMKLSKERSTPPIFVDVISSYEQPLDQVKGQKNGFEITRRLYKKDKNRYHEIGTNTKLKVGDVIKAKYYIKSSENRSYVRVSVLRSGALQPTNDLSYHTGNYYREVRDSHNNYYFELMPEEVNVVEEEFVVWYSGEFRDGLVRAQSLFTPVYQGNSDTFKIEIE